MKICENCKKEYESEIKFCPDCGQKLKEDDKTEKTISEKNNSFVDVTILQKGIVNELLKVWYLFVIPVISIITSLQLDFSRWEFEIEGQYFLINLMIALEALYFAYITYCIERKNLTIHFFSVIYFGLGVLFLPFWDIHISEQVWKILYFLVSLCLVFIIGYCFLSNNIKNKYGNFKINKKENLTFIKNQIFNFNIFNYKKRITRIPYCLLIILLSVLVFLLNLNNSHVNDNFVRVISLISMLFASILGTKRMKDIGIQGYLPLILGITLIVLLIINIFIITNPEINDYRISNFIESIVPYEFALFLILSFTLFFIPGIDGDTKYGQNPFSYNGKLIENSNISINNKNINQCSEHLFSLRGLLYSSGRRNRKPYILFRLLIIVPLSNAAYRIMLKNINSQEIVLMSLILILIIDGFGLINDIKRAHDINISGKIPSIFFVMYILGIVFNEVIMLVIPQMLFQIFMMFKKGTIGSNKYGPDPLVEVGNIEKVEAEK